MRVGFGSVHACRRRLGGGDLAINEHHRFSN